MEVVALETNSNGDAVIPVDDYAALLRVVFAAKKFAIQVRKWCTITIDGKKMAFDDELYNALEALPEHLKEE